jgi:phosphoglucosamine mutase
LTATKSSPYSQPCRSECRGVVATIMSNGALIDTLKEQGIDTYLTKVGDKYVYEEMVKRDLILGGEQAGHIILREFNTSGDGMLTALASGKCPAKSRQAVIEAQVYSRILKYLKKFK